MDVLSRLGDPPRGRFAPKRRTRAVGAFPDGPGGHISKSKGAIWRRYFRHILKGYSGRQPAHELVPEFHKMERHAETLLRSCPVSAPEFLNKKQPS